jgi:hypothetical protein
MKESAKKKQKYKKHHVKISKTLCREVASSTPLLTSQTIVRSEIAILKFYFIFVLNF